MIEYEFADSDGNIISYEQMKSAAGEYKVRAKIKSEYASNCSFTVGSISYWSDFKLLLLLNLNVTSLPVYANVNLFGVNFTAVPWLNTSNLLVVSPTNDKSTVGQGTAQR